MAEIESQLFVITSDQLALTAIAELFSSESEADFNEACQVISGKAKIEYFEKHFSADYNLSEVIPDDFDRHDEYLSAEFLRASEGQEIMAGWVNLLAAIAPKVQAQAWGSYDEDPFEFWYKTNAKDNGIEFRESQPLKSSKQDKALLDSDYTWWHEGLPDEIKVGILAKKFNRKTGKKNPVKKKAGAKSGTKKYKNLFEAAIAQDYIYLEQKITKRNFLTQDVYRNTLMQGALLKEDLKLVKILVDKGYDLDGPCLKNFEQTILIWACQHCTHQHKEAMASGISYLLELGADVNVMFGDSTALHAAVRTGRLDVVETLVSAGVDINVQDGRGRTALFYIEAEEAVAILDFLVSRGADIHIQDNWNRTALFEAAHKQLIALSKRLIELGLVINHRDDSGDTPLHGCKWQHQKGIAKTLLSMGADPTIKNKKGEKPADNQFVASLINGKKSTQ